MNKSITKELRSMVSISLGTTKIAWIEVNGVRYMNIDYPHSLDNVEIITLGELAHRQNQNRRINTYAYN